MSKKKQGDVAEALNLLRDANLQLPGSEKCQLDQLIETYFVGNDKADSDSECESDTSEFVDLDSVHETGKETSHLHTNVHKSTNLAQTLTQTSYKKCKLTYDVKCFTCTFCLQIHFGTTYTHNTV